MFSTNKKRINEGKHGPDGKNQSHKKSKEEKKKKKKNLHPFLFCRRKKNETTLSELCVLQKRKDELPKSKKRKDLKKENHKNRVSYFCIKSFFG